MALNTNIPYTTKEDIEYLIRFTLFEEEHVPEGVNLPIVDIVIEANASFEEISNSASSLFRITQIICEYAMINDAIYYCYCSDKPIKRSKNKSHLTHQEYRSYVVL